MSLQLSREERIELIEQLAAFPGQLAAVVEPLDTRQRVTAFMEGEWSVAQNVHHLADSHMTSYLRVMRILTQDNPTLADYDQDEYARLPEANSANWDASMTLLRGLHARWAAMYRQLSDTQWARMGHYPAYNRDRTVEDHLIIYVRHGVGHIDQIQRTLAAGQDA